MAGKDCVQRYANLLTHSYVHSFNHSNPWPANKSRKPDSVFDALTLMENPGELMSWFAVRLFRVLGGSSEYPPSGGFVWSTAFRREVDRRAGWRARG